MKNDHDINLFQIDYRSLTPAQRQVFREAIVARAHRERAKFVRAQFRALFGWLDRMVEMVLRAVFTPKTSGSPSRRA